MTHPRNEERPAQTVPGPQFTQHGLARRVLRAGLAIPCLVASLHAPAGAAAPTNDFPTLERVLWVQECMARHVGPVFEMQAKCACALDTLAAVLPYEEYVGLSTVGKAITMAGERGAAIRDAPALAAQARRLRELEAGAEQACFLATPAAPVR